MITLINVPCLLFKYSKTSTHVSHIPCHVAGVPWHVSFFLSFCKVVEQDDGGSNINGVYPSSFKYMIVSFEDKRRNGYNSQN